MPNSFDLWNITKKRIHEEGRSRLYNNRDVWWCVLGINIGYEHSGVGIEFQRPVLVLKGLSASTCLVLPLTSSANKHPMRVPIGIIDGKEASAILSQMRVVDTKRFLNKICRLDIITFDKIRKAAKDLL